MSAKKRRIHSLGLLPNISKRTLTDAATSEVKRKALIVSAAALIVAAIAAVAFWPGEKEPEYHGKKLSEWLALEREQPRESAEAVRAIGTNAIPFLLRWI